MQQNKKQFNSIRSKDRGIISLQIQLHGEVMADDSAVFVLNKSHGIPVITNKWIWYKNPIKWFRDRKYIKMMNILVEEIYG